MSRAARPKIATMPRELDYKIKNIREILLDLCIKYWSRYCDRYLKGKYKDEYDFRSFSLTDEGIDSYDEINMLDILALFNVYFNKKLIRRFVTGSKDKFKGMLIQDNKILPLAEFTLSYIGYQHETLVEQYIKQYMKKQSFYCWCAFDPCYVKTIRKKSIVDEFLYFVRSAIGCYLVYNNLSYKEVDTGGRSIPYDLYLLECLPGKYEVELDLTPTLYCMWFNDDFVVHNMTVFEMLYREGSHQRPKKITPYFVFQSTDEEMQKILSLEPVKQIVEKMKQIITSNIFEQIKHNVSRLG
jgi:hypothetical protein